MSERAQRLADKFEQARNNLIATVESIPDDKWSLICQNDERPVGVVAHHVGTAFSYTFEAAELAGTGQPVPPMTMELVNAGNAKHALEHGNCSKEDALEVIRKNGDHVRKGIAAMSDEHLDRRVNFPLVGGSDPVTVEQILDRLVIGHINVHLQDIKATVA